MRMLIYHRSGWNQAGHVASLLSQVAKQKDGLGNPKYVNLMVVVKAVLCISHRQADVERGFSLNKHIVDESRVNLKHHTISVLCTVKDVINKYQDVHIGARWRIRLNHPSVAAMKPYVKLL